MKRPAYLGLLAGCMGLSLMPIAAWASLSQGYATTSSIATGSLVSLDEKVGGQVDVADLTNVGRLFGVAVPPSSTSIALSGSGANQAQVATSGTVSLLVTNAGGDIKLGDYITVSPIAGVGQKVGDTSTRVIGTAQADFNGSGDGTTKRTIDTGSGKTEVSIGQIPVVVAVSSYTATDGKQPYVIPSWLQSLSNTLAGKAVSPVRIIIAGAILLVALVCVTVLLYAAVRNSIISIGRNPLSRNSVLRGLLEVMAIVVGILIATAVAMYLVIAR
ncbi:MAG TPA: hypothetical protein VI322_04460 [Candidatus Saccharimonadia bacterium]